MQASSNEDAASPIDPLVDLALWGVEPAPALSVPALDVPDRSLVHQVSREGIMEQMVKAACVAVMVRY